MHLLASTEGDAFALCMIGVIVCGLAFISIIFFSILRNAAKRNHDVEELLDEVSRDDRPGKSEPVASGQDRKPWEKDGEWWKK